MKTIFNRWSNRIASFALGGALVVAGSALAFTQKGKTDFKHAAINLPVDERPIARDLGGHASFAPVVKKVTPGVVKILTTTKVHNTAWQGNPGNPGMPGMDDFLRRFFGDDFEKRVPR